MRVISGKSRGTKLLTPDGLTTRPTTDRIKETLFNILQNDIDQCRFLDLFGGSGGIAIEAASRGASFCCLAEPNKAAADCIKKNIQKAHVSDVCRLMETDAISACKKLEMAKEKPFDFIFMDPPYEKELEKQVLQYLAGSKLISTSTQIIVEASINTDFTYLDDLGYHLVRRKEYKTNVHVFIQYMEGRHESNLSGKL